MPLSPTPRPAVRQGAPWCMLPQKLGSPETGMYMLDDETPGRLPRMSANDSPILGVAGGLAAHYGVSPNLVRLAFVLATLLFLAGLLAYVALAFAMPWPPLAPRSARMAFIVGAAPIVALTLASTLAAVLDVKGFSSTISGRRAPSLGSCWASCWPCCSWHRGWTSSWAPCQPSALACCASRPQAY